MTITSAIGTAAGSSAAIGVGQTRRYIKPPKNHRIYKLLGQVTSDWAHFEHKLDRLIWCLTPTISSIPVCITAQLIGPNPRLNSIVALLTMRSVSQPVLEKYIKEVNKLSGQTNSVAEKRNRFVHDPWYYDKASKVVAQFKSMPRSDRRYGIKESDVSEIEQTLKNIENIPKRSMTYSIG